MPDDKIKISALPSALSLNNTDELPVVQDNGGAKTTKRSTVQALGSHIAETMNFSSELETTANSLVGAINEAASDKNLAEQYSNLLTYEDDDFVIYKTVLYKCITAVTAPEDFDPTKWTVAKVSDLVGTGGASALSDLTDVNIDDQTLESGQVLRYDGSKWVNSDDIKPIIYGFHIDSSESDPEDAVTYLMDAVGMTPCYMDYVNDKFIWGSWKGAFFLPRPCMLKNDGTVAYYLDEDDYTKKIDGTASDVADDTFDGNAMMEWGRDNQRIWIKVVPDSLDPTSVDIFIANKQIDADYHAWSFIDSHNHMKDHFYTPIYNGTIDGNGKLRSISGKTYTELCQSKTAAQEIAAAELNNVGTDKGWYTEVFADNILIQYLCYLMGKSLDVQTVFGYGNGNNGSAASNMLGTGTMDSKGLFWGENTGTLKGVKVFGMENFWGNQWRRYAGHYLVERTNYYKLTRNTADGSTAADYSTSGATGYLVGEASPSSNNYYQTCKFNSKGCLFVNSVQTVSPSSSKYYCDYFYQDAGTRYALRGGYCYSGRSCGFYVCLVATAGNASWSVGSAPSYK